MSYLNKYKAMQFAMRLHLKELERRIEETREPRDAQHMTVIETFVYGQKTAMEQEAQWLRQMMNGMEEEGRTKHE